MHIVSQVEGTLSKDKTLYDLMRATFPAGTLSGAPKVRAMEIIEELEPTGRGVYGGAAGYLGYDGNLDLAIAIRTVLALPDRLAVQVGAGVVYDSVPERELLRAFPAQPPVAAPTVPQHRFGLFGSEIENSLRSWFPGATCARARLELLRFQYCFDRLRKHLRGKRRHRPRNRESRHTRCTGADR